MPECQNNGARRAGRYSATARETLSRGNEYKCNNRRTVGRGIFYVVRVVSNTHYVVKGKKAIISPRLGIRGRHLLLKIKTPTKQDSPNHWKFSKVHIGSRYAHDFEPSLYMRLYNEIVQATSRSHTKS
jgi:hypothetical protein